MSYRELQLRQVIKRDYVPLKDFLLLETEYKRVLVDVDYQLQVETKEENEGLKEFSQEQDRLIKTQEEDLWNLNQSLTNLKKINQALTILAEKRKEDLEREKGALLALAKQKITNKKEAKELLSQLEEKWKREKEELETELSENQEELTKKKALLVKKNSLLSQLLQEKQRQLSHA